jgi:phage/plasmid primase-like uncharacterized protein
MAERQYLVVPYDDRDAAKAAGARWDAEAKSWWVSDKVGRDRVERWLPGRQEPRQGRITEEEARRQFGDAMRGLGLQVSGQHPIMDGKTHRVHVEGERGARPSGQYVGYLDGHPAGHIKNYKLGVDTNWKSDGALNPSVDPAEARAQAAQRQRERDEERQAAFEATARRVSRQAERLVPITEPTPYMVAKGIQPSTGALTDREGRTTYLPAIDVEGKQWTMQYIRDDGSKRFAKDSRKEGTFHIVGGDLSALEAAPVLIQAEGYATARDVATAARQPVVVAFDSGNLGPVAEALHGRFPNKPVLIAGDDDKRVELDKGFNPGRDKATDAAALVGGAAIFPKFAPGEQEGDPRSFTDFNDLKMRSQLGREEVERQIVVGIELAIAARAIANQPELKERKTMAEDTPTDRTPAPAETPAPAPTDAANSPERQARVDELRDSDRPSAANENTIAPAIAGASVERDAPPKAGAPADRARDEESDKAAAPDRDQPAAAPTGKAARSVGVGDMPEEISRRYYVQKSVWSGEPGYYESASSKEAAFRDQGGRIVAGNASPAVARDLVAVAQHRGWEPVQVNGTSEFRREIWLAASERGMEVRGYKPTERDLQEVARRRERETDSHGNAIAPVEGHTVERGTTAPATASRERPNGEDRGSSFATGIQGKLIEVGEARFDESKKDSKPSPYVDIELEGGERKRAWGVGLPDALERSGVVVGEVVTVQRLAREKVQVTETVQDKETGAARTVTRDAERNRWSVEPVSPDRSRASPVDVDRQPSPTRPLANDRQDRDTPPQARVAPVEERPREYLAVPYKEREAAKAAGARWDGEARKWYAAPEADTASLNRWRAGDRPDDRNTKLIGNDRNARAQMRVIETVVARTLADNPEAAERLLKEARSELAGKVEQGKDIRKTEVRTRQSARSVSADIPPPAPRPTIERAPPPPKRPSPERSRSR